MELALRDRLNDTTRFIRSRSRFKPKYGIILGSGLGGLARHVDVHAALQYAEIPNFPVSTVKGHAGQLILGQLEKKNVVVMEGRFHFYEGYSMAEVTYPIRTMHALGIKHLIVSNACGGLNRTFEVGDLMLITDIVNHMYSNPLTGPNDESIGPRFPDMSRPFSDRLNTLAKKIAREQGTDLKTGTYIAVTGPNYETKAELRYLARMVGDAVGMSTVPEVIVAKHCGITEILGISVVTDLATGEFTEQVTHEAVVKAANEAGPRFVNLIREVVRQT